MQNLVTDVTIRSKIEKYQTDFLFLQADIFTFKLFQVTD